MLSELDMFQKNIDYFGYLFSIKGTRIQSQFLFLMEKSILYAKITVSQKKYFKKSGLNIIYAFYFHSYNNATNTH